MKCDLDYCIYNKNFECILHSIQINSFGMCEQCVLLTLDKGFLETEKENQLK